MTKRELSSETFALFPTPVQRIAGLFPRVLLSELSQRFAPNAQQRNTQSDQLAHTQMLAPDADTQLRHLCSLIAPHVQQFGELLLGERLTWTIKELWVNVLETGGRQALHNHANSFVSGVVYLSDSHSSANTLFSKSPSSSDFVFNNQNERAALGAYNAGKWSAPAAAAGDMLLFPSYLLHEVPKNQGGRRISLAFNAIPDRLDSWGYTLTLAR
jgi:uncharacterized protein (TIGR02466 family)